MRLIPLLIAGTALVTFQVTSPATLTAGVNPDIRLELDCDPAVAGVQAHCPGVPGEQLVVDLVLVNDSASAVNVGSMGIWILSPDTTRLNPPNVPADANGFGANPRFNGLALLDEGWACNAPLPAHDTGENGPGTATSRINCYDAAPHTDSVPAGDSVALMSVIYDVPSSANGGTVNLSFYAGDVTDSEATEPFLVDCTVPGSCVGASVTVPDVGHYLDCDLVRPGIQNHCHVGILNNESRSVGWIVKNRRTDSLVATYVYLAVTGNDQTKLDPPNILDTFSLGTNDNPDFNESSMGMGWQCLPQRPIGDADPDPLVSYSVGFCLDYGTTDIPIAPGALRNPATVHYNVPAGATAGPVDLSLTDAKISTETFESWDCSGVSLGVDFADCHGATVVLYCERERADVNGNGHVSAQDVGMVAAALGANPPPDLIDQDFNGAVTAADLGIVSSWLSTPASLCPA